MMREMKGRIVYSAERLLLILLFSAGKSMLMVRDEKGQCYEKPEEHGIIPPSSPIILVGLTASPQ